MASEASVTSDADWANIPPVLVVSIGELLPAADLTRLPAVCSSWAWALGRACSGRTRPPPRHSFPGIRSFPWLILPDEGGEDADRITLLRITDGSTHCISPLPEIHGRRCVGSSPCGWLVTLDLFLEPRLLNPLTREEVSLPSLLTAHNQVVATYTSDGSISGFVYTEVNAHYLLKEFREFYVQKILLTSAPPSCVAVAILSVDGLYALAFVRPGDSAWVLHPPFMAANFEDIVYREEEGKLYSVNRFGDVLVFDLFSWGKNGKGGSPSAPQYSLLAKGNIGWHQTHRRYIVFLKSGDLLQIGRHLRWFVKRETGFTKKIYILKLDQKDNCWKSLKDLGDESLFLGCNGSMSVSISEVPRLQKNCIYFTEDFCYGTSDIHRIQPRDVGVYNLKSKKSTKFFSMNCKVNWPPPIWFMPLVPRNPWE